MKELCMFNCKVREHKQGQMLITIPKKHRHNFCADHPVIVVISQPKKEESASGEKKI